MSSDPANFDLARVLGAIRRRTLLIVLCVVITGAAAYGVSKAQQKQYTASASLLFEPTQLQQQAAGLPGVQVVDPQSQQNTDLKLATLPAITTYSAKVLGMTPSAVSDAVDVSVQGNTNLISVEATASSPKLAAGIANTYATQAVANRERLDSAFYASSLRAVNAQYQALSPALRAGVQGQALKQRAASLQTLQNLQGSEVQVAQPATAPTSPSSPKVTRNTAIGLLAGLLLGLGIAFGLERFDRRLREPSDLEDAYGLPLVGVVPESPALEVKRMKADKARPLPGREAEIFGLLRARVRYSNVDREMRLVLVISAAPGDGKSTVARNLAFAAASAGDRVLLVEADLRRPTAASDLGLERSPGIAEVLVESLPLEDAVQPIESASGHARSTSVDVLVAGGVLPPNPTQAIGSHAMQALLARAKELYDFVVIDTPPLALLSDAFSLLRVVDGVLIVSRLGENRRDVAARLKESLDAAGAPLIGVVANGYAERAGSPYGYYGYGYSAYLDDAGSAEPRQASQNGSPDPAAERVSNP